MCIRDSRYQGIVAVSRWMIPFRADPPAEFYSNFAPVNYVCLLYTSDAADERSSVDLGGRRIIKKKKNRKLTERRGTIMQSNNNKVHNNDTHKKI